MTTKKKTNQQDVCNIDEQQRCDHMRITLDINQLFTTVLIPSPSGGFYSLLGVETDTGVHVFKFCPWCGEPIIPRTIHIEPIDDIDYK